MFDRSRNIITFSVVFIIFDALAALVIAFSSTGRNSVKTILIVCTVIALPFMTAVLRHSIYILRLKKFLAELPEEPEHYFRKSSYQMKDRFYWFSDHFFDMRKLRKVPYEKIRSITVDTASVGLGRVRFGSVRRGPLIPFKLQLCHKSQLRIQKHVNNRRWQRETVSKRDKAFYEKK